MAQSLFTKDSKAKKDFRKLWSAAEKKGFKNKEALVYISFLKNSISWIKAVSDFIKDPSKVSASDITQKVIEVTLSESKDLISAGLINDVVFKVIKTVTPAKILDIAMTANEGGAMAYDWMTDPSLVRLSMKKVGNTLDIVHSIPDLKAIRYLRVPDAIADNGLVDVSVPNDGLGKMAWDVKNDRLTPLGTTGDVNHFLVMSGFRSSLENQSAYLKVDDDNIEQLMNNKNIRMLWHVKKLSLADEVGKVSQASRTKATAFNNNFEDRAVEDSWLPWADAVVSLDKKNPIHKAVFDGMKADMSKYFAIDFSEFWKETIGSGADYPLEHKTPGIYSDYTNISFKTDQSAKGFENTVNMYVLPDFTTRQETVRTDAAVFKGEKLNELQLTFRASSNWSEATSGTLGESGSLWMVLTYAENGKTRWTQPVEITGLPTSGMVTKPFALPEGVNPNTIAVFIYNDTMEAYARKSGRNILTVLKMADYYRLKPGINQTPLMYLNVSALKPASKSLLELVDSDGDGLADIWDAFPQDKRYQFDSDKDGMADEWEEQHGLNAYDASDAIADADRDGLSNVSEFQHDANPHKGDSDDDGMPDAWEVQYGLDPAIPEDAKTDFDGDGISNLDEYKNGTDPLEANALTAPQNFKATPSNTQATLTWDAVLGATGYAYCTSQTQNSADCATYSASNPLWKDTADTSVVVTGLTNDIRSYFRVVAKGANGKESAVSEERSATPIAITTSTGVKAVAVGSFHSLALKQDGTLMTWGLVGDDLADPPLAEPLTIPVGLNGIVAIAAGASHSLALKQDGTVVAWGWQGNAPATVPTGLSGVTAISASCGSSMALKQDGTVVAWEWSGSGQSPVPTGLSNVKAIAAGCHHYLAVKQDGTVAAWGYAWDGQRAEDAVPAGLTGVVAVAAGSSGHSLALKQDGTVVAWGGDASVQGTVPAGLTGVVAIAAGGDGTSLAVKQDGKVVTWGHDIHVDPSTVAAGLSGIVAVAADGGDPFTQAHFLALKQDATVVAWGGNGNGQATVPSDLTKPADNTGWTLNPTTGHYYKALDNCGNWEQCEMAAQAVGAHLVVLDDQAENDWVVNAFKVTETTRGYWIGYTDKEQEGVWKTVVGDMPTYVNWDPREPNGAFGDEDFAQMVGSVYDPLSNYGQWNDLIGYDTGWIGYSNSAIIERTTAPTGNTNPFTVQAADEVGTAFTVPEGKTQCTFNATGTWQRNPDPIYLTGPYGDGYACGCLVPVPAGYVYGLVATSNEGDGFNIGNSAQITVSGGDILHFLMNDGVGAFANNSGALSVSWSCQ